MAIVYIHRRKDNNKIFYIGIGKSERRAFDKTARTKFWKNIVAKHGLIVEVTHTNILRQEAESIEKYLISFWREVEGVKLCNLTDGGNGATNLKLPIQVIKKRNEAIKSSWNEERKLKYRKIFSGENNPFYGKKHSELSRLKISKNQNPRKFITEEHKQKISIANKGKKRNDEVKKKLSDAKKGKPSWNKGIPCSNITRNKIREKVKLLYTEEYKKMISEKTKKAFQENQLLRKKISDKAKGRQSSRKGINLTEEQKKKISIGLKEFYKKKKHEVHNWG